MKDLKKTEPKKNSKHFQLNKPDSAAKMKKQKAKQRLAIKEIREELKKFEQFNISLDGLQKLSSTSITSIQKRRQKSVLRLIKSTQDLLKVIQDLKKIEIRYNRS